MIAQGNLIYQPSAGDHDQPNHKEQTFFFSPLVSSTIKNVADFTSGNGQISHLVALSASSVNHPLAAFWLASPPLDASIASSVHNPSVATAASSVHHSLVAPTASLPVPCAYAAPGSTFSMSSFFCPCSVFGESLIGCPHSFFDALPFGCP